MNSREQIIVIDNHHETRRDAYDAEEECVSRRYATPDAASFISILNEYHAAMPLCYTLLPAPRWRLMLPLHTPLIIELIEMRAILLFRQRAGAMISRQRADAYAYADFDAARRFASTPAFFFLRRFAMLRLRLPPRRHAADAATMPAVIAYAFRHVAAACVTSR